MTINRTYGGVAVSARRADRRNRFIDAAIELFGTAGYSNTPVEALCAATKLSRRQFYEEFGQREDVLIAAYDQIQNDATTAVMTRAGELVAPFDPERVVSDLLSVHLESVASSPARVRVAYVEIIGVSDRVEAHRRGRRAQWVPLIEQVARSIYGPDVELPGAPGMAATALIGAINALTHEWSLATPRAPLSELVDVLRALVSGIGGTDTHPA